MEDQAITLVTLSMGKAVLAEVAEVLVFATIAINLDIWLETVQQNLKSHLEEAVREALLMGEDKEEVTIMTMTTMEVTMITAEEMTPLRVIGVHQEIFLQ